MKHSFFRESKCLGSWLHRFSIVSEYTDGVLEVCEICHKTKFFPIRDGKVDNFNYMSWHLRSALPKFHPYYEHEFEFSPYELVSPYYG